ncbi:MAG: hypothetical protein K6T80_03885 [Firmicutes bacterium]|nr:hypothetical protein [Bacillota bacterium]
MPGAGKKCDCGSGKLYEACCGARKVSSLEQVRWRRAGQELRRKLGEFADQPSFAWDAARAQDLYLGSLDQQYVDRQDDFTMERCFEWFIFDYKLSNGQTVIETFRDEQSYALNDYERALLADWCCSRISLYEVCRVIAAEGLIVEDLLGQGEYYVHDVNAASEIGVGSVLLMRVLKVGNEYEFSTSGLALPAECKSSLLHRIDMDRLEYFQGKRPEKRTLATYLRDRAHRINTWVMELGTGGGPADLPLKERVKTYRTIYAVKNWLAVLNLLKKSSSFRLIEEITGADGRFARATAAWLGEQRSRPERGVDLRPVLGHMILTPQFLVFTTGSGNDLAAAEKMLLSLFNGLVDGHSGMSRARQSRLAEAVFEAVLEAATLKAREGRRENGPNIGNYSWPDAGCAEVAGRVREDLKTRGYSQRQQKRALKLWFDFCSKERPSIRKTAAWAATVVYAFARLEMEKGVRQQDLAGEYGVASSTISSKFRQLCKSLELVAYDGRYSTKKPPRGKRRKDAPLLREY